MAILDILEYPDPRLRTKAKPVVEVDEAVRKLIDDMFETMYDAPGIGLAASQVNVHQRIIVVDVSENRDEPHAFINPELTTFGETLETEEGCLSVPGFYEPVTRYDGVRVKALDRNGKPSLYAPGHGDLPFALQRSGVLEDFIARGGRWLTVSNVDNLGASLDPRVIGLHIEKGTPMTVEIVRPNQRDVGGFPAIVNGKMMIVEAFRAPASFDVNTIPVFNTNTFVFDAEALLGKLELDWFAAFKNVDGRDVVQFERLVGQLTEFIDVTWLLVPRRGPFSRFMPIKVPADLERREAELTEMLRAQGVL